ncbi:MAG TPA: SpoIIE family protein phosphatase [Vicinamibacterales bacterium]
MTIAVSGGTVERHGGVVTWGIASLPIAAEELSGDLCSVWCPSDGALIAVVDGSGHGPEAAAAARMAADIMEPHPQESPVALILRCHEHLRGTRGAAMTLASLNLLDRTMTWLGIGNVEAVLCRAGDAERQEAERVLLRSGVVGFRLPPRLKAEVIPLKHCDTLIMATDGVKPEFADDAAIGGDPKHVAGRLLSQHNALRDDALVFVAKYEQGGSR